MTRVCGECKECCTVLVVRELNKPEHKPCTHLCGEGCSIQAKKPVSCVGYKCMWLCGELEDKHRPDRVGLLCDRLKVTEVGTTILARVARDDMVIADPTSPAARLLAQMVERDILVTLQRKNNKSSLLGKRELIRDFLERGKEQINCPSPANTECGARTATR